MLFPENSIAEAAPRQNHRFAAPTSRLGILTNQDLEKMVETTDQMDPGAHRHPRAASGGQGHRGQRSGRRSGQECLVQSRAVDLQQIDAIIVGTVTPDMMFPSTACLVQHKLGIAPHAGASISRPDVPASSTL